MPRFNNLQVSTIREFDGGLNTVSSDLNLSTKYSTIEENMFFSISGTKQKRYGTELLTDVSKAKTITETIDTVYIENNNNIYCTKPIGIYLYPQDTIRVTEPLTVAGSYKIKKVTEDEFVFIKVSGFEITATDITFVKVYNNGTTSEPISTKITKTETEKVLKIPVTTNNSLLIGHSLVINNLPELTGEHIVIDRSTTADDPYYSIKIDAVLSQTTYNNIEIQYTNNAVDDHENNRIVNITYYINTLIAVSRFGEVIAIDKDGNCTLLFNDTIAKQVSGQSGWSVSDSICFTVFNGILTIWNGVNKPLAVNFDNIVPCNYLVDEATQTNSLIPIAKYAISINHYLVVGNVKDELTGMWRPDRIMISDYNSIGTFNDGTESTLVNGGVSVDVGKIVESATSEIRGLSRYRTQLLVGFDEVSALGTLGNTIDTTDKSGSEEVTYKLHRPDFNDVINNYGCMSNRTYDNVAGDVVVLSYNGLNVFKKQTLSTLTSSDRLSTIINNKLYAAIKDLDTDTLTNRTWSVYNSKEQQYMLFIPNTNTYETTTETLCFVYTIPSIRQARSTNGVWSIFTGWNFQCGCESALDTIFLVDGFKVYTLGNADNPIYADFIGDTGYLDDEQQPTGVPITFTWEFGWQDMNNRHAKKTLRYIGISTNGTAEFTIGTNYDYIDYGACEQEIQMVGGDSVGYGNGKQRYGGGRRTNTENLFAYTAKFNLIKLKLYGSSKEDLKINSISLGYQMGNIRR